MLTIFDKQKNPVGALQTDGYYKDVDEVSVQRRLNSDYTLSFLLAMQSDAYSLIEKEGLIECEGQKYVIKEIERDRKGMGRTVKVTAPHIMRRLMDIRIPYADTVDEALGADISTMLNIISNATGGVFTFTVIDAIDPKDVYKFGYGNCLKALQDLINLYNVEIVPDNYNIKVYSKISIDNGAQYRYGKNIISNSFKDNTNTLCTRLTGLAKDSLTIIDMPVSHLTTDEYNRLNVISGAIVDGIVKVPYLISQYASTWSTPDNTYFDSDFEDTNIDASTEAGKVELLNEMRKKLAASEIPDIQITIDAADTWKINQGDRPTLGETVLLIDSDMEMNQISARVMELTEYPFDPDKNTSVTLANYLLKDYSDIVADLSASKTVLDGLLTNKSVNTQAFEAATKQAIQDINNSKTQIIYDTRGIVLQDQANAQNQVVMSSAGIYITTDGGTTTKAAILAGKIVAEQIVGVLGQFAQVKTDNLIVGSSPIEDSLIGSANNWNNKTTRIDDTGIYTGSITTDQLIAGTAKITSALIDTIKASQIDVSTGKIVAAQIDATNLTVAAANITGTLTAAQIDATNLHVNVANIDGSLVVGTNVGLGTAQDASGVTTIINNTVTTGYVNALNVTANSVQAGWVYAGTINASQINTSGLAAEKIYKPGVPSSYGVIGGTYGDMILYYNNAEFFRIYNNLGGVSLQYNGTTFLSSSNVGGTNTHGAWDFSSSTVTGLNVTAKFA